MPSQEIGDEERRAESGFHMPRKWLCWTLDSDQFGFGGGECGGGDGYAACPDQARLPPFSPLQSPTALWSRSPWRTARWCGRRGGSCFDSECAGGGGAEGRGPCLAWEISLKASQRFLALPGTLNDQDPRSGSPPATAELGRGHLGGAPPGRGRGDSVREAAGGPPLLESNPKCLFLSFFQEDCYFFTAKEICVC